jgi:V8-like Glu-specific endopeptidase
MIRSAHASLVPTTLSFSSLAALAALGGCALDDATPQLDEAEQHTICGRTDDSQFVNDYDGTLGPSIAFVAANRSSKGAMESTASSSSAGKYCSGTLISADMFLTAGHCVDSTTVGDFVAFNYERAAGSTALLTQAHFRISAVLEDALGGVDYAIVRLEGSPGNTFGFAAVAPADPAVGAALTIIGHPAAAPKKIEAGTARSLSGNNLSYGNIDTLGGSSGSGVLDSQGRVVGVHTNGGCTATGGANFGMRISRIRAVSSIL